MKNRKIFNSLDELEPYYNEKTNTYEFIEDNKRLDIKCNFFLRVKANIIARNIYAMHIYAKNINAENIVTGDITSSNIDAWGIFARNIKAGRINVREIKAIDIKATNINVTNINARDIIAWNIQAANINAMGNISFYAVCYAKSSFRCAKIEGSRKNAKYFCLDNEIEFIKE